MGPSGGAVQPLSEISDQREDALVSTVCPCVNCGYNLFRMRLTGACPECGHAVESSVERSIWIGERINALRRLRTSFWLLAISLPLGSFAGVVFFATGVRYYYIDTLFDIAWELLLWSPAILTLVALLGLATAFAGIADRQAGWIRNPIRIALAVRFGCMFWFYWVEALGAAPNWLYEFTPDPSIVFAFICATDISIAILIASPLGALLHRLGRPRLIRLVHVAVIAFMTRNLIIIAGFVTEFGQWLENLGRHVPDYVLVPLFAGGFGVPIVLLAIVSIWVAIVLTKISGQWKRATH